MSGTHILEKGQPTMTQTILVVDDVPIARTFNSTALQAAGYDVLEAEDGQQALQYLDGRPIAAVVCDFQMPHMNGLEFVRAVRANAQYQSLPVLMLSAEGNAQTIKETTAAGATLWIAKPVSRSQLLASVNRMLEPMA
jgi:two-component system chemotaxis response regulator CheY